MDLLQVAGGDGVGGCVSWVRAPDPSPPSPPPQGEGRGPQGCSSSSVYSRHNREGSFSPDRVHLDR